MTDDGSSSTSPLTSKPADRLVFQNDINVVAYTSESIPVWASGTVMSEREDDTDIHLVLYNSGSLQIVITANDESSFNQIYWTLLPPNNNVRPPEWNCIGNFVPNGGTLKEGDYLCHGDATLGFDRGSLVLDRYYGPKNGWRRKFRSSSSTSSSMLGTYAKVQTDGNVVIYDQQNRPTWSLRSDDMPGAVIGTVYESFVVKNGTSFVDTKSFQNIRGTCIAGTTELLSGQSLDAAERLCDDDGHRMFGLDDLGDLAYWNKLERFEKIWSARTGGSYDTRLVMQHDGNLVVYQGKDNKVLWASGTFKSNDDDVNLKLRVVPDVAIVSQDDDEVVYWTLDSDSSNYLPEQLPNCVSSSPIQPGQKLRRNDAICDAEGNGSFGLDVDGRLYTSSNWFYMDDSWTGSFFDQNGKLASYAIFQHDGNFVAYTSDDEAVYSTRTAMTSNGDTTYMDYVCHSRAICDIEFSDDIIHVDGCRRHYLRTGEVLLSEQYLCNGDHSFGIDDRGYLVYRFRNRTRVIIAAAGVGVGGYANRLKMHVDGNLVLTNYKNEELWRTNVNVDSGTDATDVMTELDNTGSVSIQDPNGKMLLQIVNYFA